MEPLLKNKSGMIDHAYKTSPGEADPESLLATPTRQVQDPSEILP